MDKDNFNMTTFCRNNFTHSFMLVLCLCCTGFSLVVNSGSSVVAVRGLLTALALLVVEKGV